MSKEWDKHPTGALMMATLELLSETTQTDLAIYKGTGIKPDWLGRFRNGRVTDPGVNRVECLYTF